MSLASSAAGIARIVRRSLRQHALSTVVTTLSVALAAGLVMTVFSINAQTSDALNNGARGFDAVLGARGSQLNLVLNSVYHLKTSNGNIPWSLYQVIKHDRRVSLAVPYAVGDNYQGYRIVGTTSDLFTKYEPQSGEHLRFREGAVFDEKNRDAVIGSLVARRLSLKIGDQFNSFHGLVYDIKAMHADKFTVVGILEPTNSPMDRVIWIPIEAVYRMEGHELHGTGEAYKPEAGVEIPDEAKEVSAVMLKLRGPAAGFTLDAEINRQGKDATLAWPIAVSMNELFEVTGWVNKVLLFVSYLVVAVASASILVGIYNSMNERRRDFAIFRAIGARRRTIFAAVVAEAGAIGALGAITGTLVYAVLLVIASPIIYKQTGFELSFWHVDVLVACTPAAMVVLAALAGVVPAVKAYDTDVATNLAAHVMNRETTMPNRLAPSIVVLAALLALVAGCGRENTPPSPTPAMHEHHAPHQGCLVELGEEYAHLELVLDPATGNVTGYVLDGEAEKPVRTGQAAITIQISTITGTAATTRPARDITLALNAVANPLSGERVGDTSQFEGQTAELIGATKFEGKVVSINARGRDFKDVAFAYPGGNEVKK